MTFSLLELVAFAPRWFLRCPYQAVSHALAWTLSQMLLLNLVTLSLQLLCLSPLFFSPNFSDGFLQESSELQFDVGLVKIINTVWCIEVSLLEIRTLLSFTCCCYHGCRRLNVRFWRDYGGDQTEQERCDSNVCHIFLILLWYVNKTTSSSYKLESFRFWFELFLLLSKNISDFRIGIVAGIALHIGMLIYNQNSPDITVDQKDETTVTFTLEHGIAFPVCEVTTTSYVKDFYSHQKFFRTYWTLSTPILTRIPTLNLLLSIWRMLTPLMSLLLELWGRFPSSVLTMILG